MNTQRPLWNSTLKLLETVLEPPPWEKALHERAATTGPGGAEDVLVMDVGGSMNHSDYPPTRLDGAKQAGARFLDQRAATAPEAMVGIVSFSDNATVASPPLRVKPPLAQLQQALRGLTTCGGTNTAAGLRLARRQVERGGRGCHPRLLLLTDGHSNPDSHPVAVAEELKARGIQLDLIGIGGSPAEVNEAELKRMASVVQGELRYWFITSVADLVRKFEALALREIK